MAKGSAANPADAFRKAQRKKELKKNKAGRAKTRDFALVKKDTTELEEAISILDGAEPEYADPARLKELKEELEKINKKKAEYVEEHPEQRALVYKRRPRNAEGSSKVREEIILPKRRNYFNKKGLPRHPERSIYYDPVMNPHGMPPPGQLYEERALLPGEVDSEASDAENDDDILMPEGAPPGFDQPIEDDEDFMLPDSPPPSAPPIDSASVPFPPPLPGIPHPPPGVPPVPFPSFPPGAYPLLPHGVPPPPPPPGFPPPHGSLPPPPPPPPGFPGSYGSLPPPPPGFFGHSSSLPPPPPGFPIPPAFNMFPPTAHPMPSRPISVSSMQDPLSHKAHQPYQAYKPQPLASPTPHGQAPKTLSHPSLPAKPRPPPADFAAATISAAPELRDLKKESTAFMPAALRKKGAIATKASAAAPKINSAPTLGPTDVGDGQAAGPSQAKPNLLSVIKQFAPSTKPAAQPQREKKADDYDQFVEEMGDILGS